MMKKVKCLLFIETIVVGFLLVSLSGCGFSTWQEERKHSLERKKTSNALLIERAQSRDEWDKEFWEGRESRLETENLMRQLYAAEEKWIQLNGGEPSFPNPMDSVTDLDLTWLRESGCFLNRVEPDDIRLFCLGWAGIGRTRNLHSCTVLERLQAQLSTWLEVHSATKPEAQVKIVESELGSFDKSIASCLKSDGVVEYMRSEVESFEWDKARGHEQSPLFKRFHFQAERILIDWGCREINPGEVDCPTHFWSRLSPKYRQRLLDKISLSANAHSVPLNPHWDSKSQERFLKWGPIIDRVWEELKSL